MKYRVRFWRWIDKKLKPNSRHRKHLYGVLRRDGIVANIKFMRLSHKYTKSVGEK